MAQPRMQTSETGRACAEIRMLKKANDRPDQSHKSPQTVDKAEGIVQNRLCKPLATTLNIIRRACGKASFAAENSLLCSTSFLLSNQFCGRPFRVMPVNRTSLPLGRSYCRCLKYYFRFSVWFWLEAKWVGIPSGVVVCPHVESLSCLRPFPAGFCRSVSGRRAGRVGGRNRELHSQRLGQPFMDKRTGAVFHKPRAIRRTGPADSHGWRNQTG